MNEHDHDHDHDDAYLWSGQGTSEDVAVLERSLAPLRWRPRPLALPSVEVAAANEVAKIEDARQRRDEDESERASARWWPAVVAGLVAAAAVLALLLLWPKRDAAVDDRAPTIQPVAPPTSTDSPASPDLKDPFGPRESADSAERNPEPEPEREGAPSISPDLVNPFADRSDTPARRKPKPPASPYSESPDLKDPFKRIRPEPEPADEILDPFEDRDDPVADSSDLKDPFAR